MIRAKLLILLILGGVIFANAGMAEPLCSGQNLASLAGTACESQNGLFLLSFSSTPFLAPGGNVTAAGVEITVDGDTQTSLDVMFTSLADFGFQMAPGAQQAVFYFFYTIQFLQPGYFGEETLALINARADGVATDVIAHMGVNGPNEVSIGGVTALNTFQTLTSSDTFNAGNIASIMTTVILDNGARVGDDGSPGAVLNSFGVTPTPEPATMGMLGAGFLALALLARKAKV